jgi:hypothetical protein
MTNTILDKIIYFTNKKIRELQKKYKEKRHARQIKDKVGWLAFTEELTSI